MKKSFVMMFALVFLFTSVLCAQVSENQKQDPVVQETQRLRREISRLRQEIRDVEKNSATRSAEENKNLILEQSKALYNAQKSLQASIDASKTEAQKANNDQMRTQRIGWVVVGMVILLGIIFLVWFLKRNRAEKNISVSENPTNLVVLTGPQVVPCIELQPEVIREPEILVNPTIDQLRKFSESHEGITEIPIILRIFDLDTDVLIGDEFCKTELRPTGKPVIWFSGQDDPVSWGKSMKCAKEIIIARKQKKNREQYLA